MIFFVIASLMAKVNSKSLSMKSSVIPVGMNGDTSNTNSPDDALIVGFVEMNSLIQPMTTRISQGSSYAETPLQPYTMSSDLKRPLDYTSTYPNQSGSYYQQSRFSNQVFPQKEYTTKF